MIHETCRQCEHCCKCCANSRYKDDCDLCSGDRSNFRSYSHMKFCPSSGLSLNKPEKPNPVVVIGPSSPTKKEIGDAVNKFFKEHRCI